MEHWRIMAFSLGDIDRIMGHLGYPVDEFHQQYIATACDKVSAVGGAPAEARVIGYINNLDTAQTGIVAGAGGGMLKKADVLEWAIDIKAGGRSAGYLALEKRLRKMLADSLGIKEFSKMAYSDKTLVGNRINVC
jgi:hypothetical protein